MNQPTPIDEEYVFDDGLIISSTDLDGIINYTNKKFCEITGYSKEELKGQNHNIIRHPNMPKQIFEDLWKKIKEGQEWTGIVKNLRKDGKYYWAYSHISPVIKDGAINGYTAAIRPATASEVEESEPLYKDLLEQEK